MKRPGDEIAMAVVAPFQPSLLDYRPPESSPRAAPQPENLARVGGELGPVVLDFAREFVGQEFCEAAFTEWVTSRRPGGRGAKGSPTRILRLLRAAGFLSYVVTNRAASRYRIEWVKAS